MMDRVFSNAPAGETPDQEKRRRIVHGAMTVFHAYGFARTTMDDIARAAGMSRPALYLVFRNKTDIFRAGAALLLEQSLAIAARVLQGEGGFADRLLRSIDEGILAMMRDVASSPHGGELLDLKHSIGADVALSWRQDLALLVVRAIDAEAARRRVDLAARNLSAQALADMMLDGLEGAKARTTDPQLHLQATRSLVTVIDLALQPRG